jgi:hypothetical protein
MYLTAARFQRESYDSEESVRRRVDHLRKHLDELALDVGLDPERNVTVSMGEEEVRVGVSEEMDLYLREAPGEWR